MIVRILVAAGIVGLGVKAWKTFTNPDMPADGSERGCKKCGTRFGSSEGPPIADGVACPNCGEVHFYPRLGMRE